MRTRCLTLSCLVTTLALTSASPGRAGALQDDAERRCTERLDAQRLLRAEVRVGNKVVLRGTTSDDGSQDADEVWSMAHTIKLFPTKEFASLKVPADADEFMVLGTPIPPDPVADNELHEHDAVFQVSIGGKYETMALKIERVAPVFGKPWWRIPRDTLESQFNFRLISRRLARELKKPRRRN